MITEEIWKDIPGYEGLYQASNLGRFRSLPRKGTKGGIMKCWTRRNTKCRKAAEYLTQQPKLMNSQESQNIPQKSVKL